MNKLLSITLFSIIPTTQAIYAHDAAHTGGDGVQHSSASKIEISTDNEQRHIHANGIANHTTGKFPNKRNPHSITTQNYRHAVPEKGVVAEKFTPLERQAFGIATNGVLFDPNTAEYWNNDRTTGWNYEALSGKIDLGEDIHHAHVQPNGAYHYHGMPTGLIEIIQKSKAEKKQMTLVGWAADGFPIYAKFGYVDPNDPSKGLKEMHSSYQLKSGDRPGSIDPKSLKRVRQTTNSLEPGGSYDGTFVQDYDYKEGSGDLDQANGRFGKTPEFPEGTYHYYITAEFPFVPRFFRGAPSPTFKKRHSRPR
ncbi:YHYH protein [Rubritalea sp.]|uniref:YHYH protein n=1 Tax=Rubritalea sp. TaxID=2109375 RepID=UPI003EF1C081